MAVYITNSYGWPSVWEFFQPTTTYTASGQPCKDCEIEHYARKAVRKHAVALQKLADS